MCSTSKMQQCGSVKWFKQSEIRDYLLIPFLFSFNRNTDYLFPYIHLHEERKITFEKKNINHRLILVVRLYLLLPTGETSWDWLQSRLSCETQEKAWYSLNYFHVLIWGNYCICVVLLQIYLRFLDYEMQNSNECKRNFVAVYDGSSSVGDLKAKFCSTVANDVMLRTGLGVIRMWADEGSRNSRFQMLFTSFQERKILCTWLFVLHLGPGLQVRQPLMAFSMPCEHTRVCLRSSSGHWDSLSFLLAQWQERATYHILVTYFGTGIIALLKTVHCSTGEWWFCLSLV